MFGDTTLLVYCGVGHWMVAKRLDTEVTGSDRRCRIKSITATDQDNHPLIHGPKITEQAGSFEAACGDWDATRTSYAL